MKKKEIVDDVTMKRAITRITYEIIERNKNLDKIVLAGIKTRGVYIAQRIQERLKQLENLDVPLIELDTKAYRDDVKSEQDTSLIPIEIDGTDVILVDDVLYTGRTIRAAIDNIVSHGRPARVGLAVLVDRGHRELPIRADYVGKNIPTSQAEEIEVLVEKNDDLIKKIGIFMGGPTPVDEDEEPQEISPEDYIIIDGTDSEPDSSDDDYVDEAGADIMESATEEYF